MEKVNPVSINLSRKGTGPFMRGIPFLKRANVLLCSIFLLSCLVSELAAVNTVTTFPARSSYWFANALGFNVNAGKEWTFDRAKEAGANYVRVQPSWPNVENMNGERVNHPILANTMKWCKSKRLSPNLVAAYGSPNEIIGTWTVKGNHPKGVTRIKVNESINTVVPIYCHIRQQNVKTTAKICSTPRRQAYYGVLIHAKKNSARELTLAAKTTRALSNGERLTITRLRYPSCKTESVSEPSVVAYANYARWLAQVIYNNGLYGSVEIWNEPVWKADVWDTRSHFYDNPPSGVTAAGNNIGFFLKLRTMSVVPGVTYDWGGSHKTGNQGLAALGVWDNKYANRFKYQSLHPYGNNPEDALWTSNYNHFPNTQTTDNWNPEAKRIRGSVALEPTITESGSTTVNDSVQTRFITRQYLVAVAGGVRKFFIYRLDGLSKNDFHLVNADNTVRTSFIRIKQMMSELKAIGRGPGALGTAPKVSNYNGTYPLVEIPVKGKQSNGVIVWHLYVYQQSAHGNNWKGLASPSAASRCDVQAPANFRVVSARDVVTNADLGFTDLGGGKYRIQGVRDNPVRIKLQ